LQAANEHRSEMFESLASCCASLNSPQDESAVADKTRQWLLELGISEFGTTRGWPVIHPNRLTKTLLCVCDPTPAVQLATKGGEID